MSADQHLLYIAGMPEPFAVPDDALAVVRRAVIDGAEARWEDEDGTITRINCHSLAAVRLVPSEAIRRQTLERRHARRQEQAKTVGEY